MTISWHWAAVEYRWIRALTRCWPWWRPRPCRAGTAWGPSHSQRMRRGDHTGGGSRSSGNKEVLICLIGPDQDSLAQTNGTLYSSEWEGAEENKIKIQFSFRLITFDICTEVQNKVPRSGLGIISLERMKWTESGFIISCQTSLSSWHTRSKIKFIPSARGRQRTLVCGKLGSWRGRRGWDPPHCPVTEQRVYPRQGQGQGRWERWSRCQVCSAWPPSSPPSLQTRRCIIWFYSACIH